MPIAVKWRHKLFRIMKRINSLFLSLAVISFCVLPAMSQVSEPDFIGESFMLKADGDFVPLDKEIVDFTSGISWSSNSFKALSIEIAGSQAQTRFSSESPLELVIRGVDNNSDPLTIITIYKLKSKMETRTVVISEDNSGTLMKSRTNSKNMIRFSGKKYGKSSYLITLTDLEVGEYGIIVSNPNNRDEKRVIVSCFGIDN